MSIFQWPFKRKQYAGLGNPRFVGDIVAANEAVLDAAIAIAGLRPADFAIISGFDYTPGSPGTYGPGILYQGQSFFYMPTIFTEGLYIIPSPQDIESHPFSDGNSRLIYTLQSAATSTTNTSYSPQFNGDMNNYRLSLRDLNASILVLKALYNNLGNSATRNIGVSPGTVAAGDDPRFGYTQAQIDNLFALKAQVLLLTTPGGFTFTPSTDYQPATKKYVDEAGGMKLRWCGTISADASIVNKQAGDLIVTASHIGTGSYVVNHNLGSVNYFITAIGYGSAFILASPRTIMSLSNNSFGVAVSDDASANDAQFQIQIIQFFP